MFSGLPDLAIVFMASNPGEPDGHCLLKSIQAGVFRFDIANVADS